MASDTFQTGFVTGNAVLMADVGLMDLVKDTISFLSAVNKSLEGDDANPNEGEILHGLKKELEEKYKSFMMDTKRMLPASPESLAELQRLQAEVEQKNAVLDSILTGLKAFELDIALRSGAVTRQRLSKSRLHERGNQEPESTSL